MPSHSAAMCGYIREHRIRRCLWFERQPLLLILSMLSCFVIPPSYSLSCVDILYQFCIHLKFHCLCPWEFWLRAVGLEVQLYVRHQTIRKCPHQIFLKYTSFFLQLLSFYLLSLCLAALRCTCSLASGNLKKLVMYGFGGSGIYTFKVIECSSGNSVPMFYCFLIILFFCLLFLFLSFSFFSFFLDTVCERDQHRWGIWWLPLCSFRFRNRHLWLPGELFLP